jgi:hypothetical protein
VLGVSHNPSDFRLLVDHEQLGKGLDAIALAREPSSFSVPVRGLGWIGAVKQNSKR